ncbi:MAG: B12-binding domain-containing radical SAM protein [Acidobacteria bacterium]|nr:B12-binding domain-containing radical SAM protein [Acidobacteriota bacterium]
MTDVLLGQSYYLRFDPKLWDAMQPYPPLGTLYAASYLRAQGYGVALFDAMLADSTGEWRAALERHVPAIAVIYEDSFNYLSKMCLLKMRQAAFQMIEAARRAGATVVVSGSDATDHRDEYIARGADYILVGEAELTLLELVTALLRPCERPRQSSGQPPRQMSIPGVLAAGQRDPIVPRPFIRDLDAVPFPAWDLVDLPRYREIWLDRHGYFSVNMATTRGCPYHCNWCSKPIYGQRYQSRSPANVVAEIRWLKHLAAPDHFWFADDIFGLKPGWIEEFAALIEQQGLQTPFKCLLRTDLVDEGVASALKRAGCRTVWVGAESGSQKILDAMEKGARVADTYRATRQLREAGIEVGYFLQFGYPGEAWTEIQDTIRMVRECLPDDIGISVAYPLPGTKFYDRVRAELGRRQNWEDSSDLAMLYQGSFPTSFYRQLHRTLHREYRARRAWRQLREGRLSLARAARPVARAVTLPIDYARLTLLRRSSHTT